MAYTDQRGQITSTLSDDTSHGFTTPTSAVCDPSSDFGGSDDCFGTGGKNSEGIEKLNVALDGSSAVTLAGLSTLSEPSPSAFREVEIHLKLGTFGLEDTFWREFAEGPPCASSPFACASSSAFFRRVPADCFFRRRFIVSVWIEGS
jgi:hypothetical protein